MDLSDAVGQFADMVTLGTDALRRIAAANPDEPQLALLLALLEQIGTVIAQMRSLSGGGE